MDRAMVHSTTFKNNPMAMVAGLATLSVFDDERVVDHAAAMGHVWRTRLEELASRHEFLHVVRGRGQMIGIEFGRPTSRGARRRWRLIEATRTAMFTQTLVVPLFHRYRILTQVAADNINVIKLLPPLIAADAEVDLFVNALDELLSEAERSSASLVEFGVTMTKGMMRRSPTSKRTVAKS
jgi:ornithine--oxo-acid transaminase